MALVRVPVILAFSEGTPREVVNDRIGFMSSGVLTIPDAGAFLESWDTSEVPEVERCA